MNNRVKTMLVFVAATFTCVAMASGCTTFGKGSTIVIGDGSPIEAGTAVDEFTYDNLSSIDVDLDVAKVVVEPGSGYSVSVDRKDYPALAIDAADGKLKIQEPNGSWNAERPSCSVTITVPESARLERLSIETDTGEISVKGVASALLKASSDVGEVRATGCLVDAYDLSADVGAITVSGIDDLENASLDLESDMGAITVGGVAHAEEYNRPGSGVKITAETDMGAITID